MNDQPTSISTLHNSEGTADHSETYLQSLLEQALLSSTRQRNLLRQPEALGEILNSIPARHWLLEVSRQTNDRNRAIKARSLIILIMQRSGAIWRGSTAPEDYAEHWHEPGSGSASASMTMILREQVLSHGLTIG
ncbi:MAG: hypothetical protein LH660_00590 [Phormidesmis sp. CAN_BIN36]|nr:hypothetical protein [Phormidesmis sp. CAN_BIN36]